MKVQEDTIVAVATPMGIGGLSVIRVSGTKAIEMVDKKFFGKHKLVKVKTQTAHFGIVKDKEEKRVDEVIVTVFREPHSYTTENMVEISCHGGIYVTKQILKTILECGARMALPGEFTKRAFLNGRIDLAQAEAVADIIQASSELSHRTSIDQLEGMLSNEIKVCGDRLLNLCSLLELELDFVEENLVFQDRIQLSKELNSILKRINNLVDSYSVGKVFREGVKVTVVGKPNVGKSSILNVLLNENRAIVTDLPGTTRDTIEENIVIDGILFNVVDTAGMRKTINPIESEGVMRAKKQIEKADIIVIVFDHLQGFTTDDIEILRYSNNYCNNKICLLVVNKIDVPIKNKIFMRSIDGLKHDKAFISAKMGIGLQDFKQKLVDLTFKNRTSIQDKSVMITNIRHKESLSKATDYLQRAQASIESGMSNEFIAIDIRASLNCLGEILGKATTDDILNNIFSKFCIGK